VRGLLVGAAVALGALLALAPCAGAVVVKGSDGAWYGLQPVDGASLAATAGPPAGIGDVLAGPEVSGQVVYHGGPVVHGLTTYALFWDPSHRFTTKTESLVAQYLAAVAQASGSTSNVFSVTPQYTDADGGAQYTQTFGGTFIDSDPYPSGGGCTQSTATATTCLYDSQAVSELESYISGHDLPTGLHTVYVILTPDTVVTCMDGGNECSNNAYCGFHSAVSTGSSTLLYIGLPFTLLDNAADAKSCQDDGNGVVQSPNGDPDFGDVALRSLTHELLETISDPLADAWYTASGDEIADLCNGVSWNADSFLPVEGGNADAGTLYTQTIGGAHYYLQGAWSNEASGCQMMSALEPSFAVPSSVTPGTPVALTGSPGTGAPVSDSAYSWSFGDGQTATGQSVSPSYSTAGSYVVTLTVTDAYGNSGSVSETIDVAAPGSATAGKTAGSSGSSGRTSGTKTKCRAATSHRAGETVRVCTTTTVSSTKQLKCKPAGTSGAERTAEVCHTVRRVVTRRQQCTKTRGAGATAWSERCTAARVVSSKSIG
jgi:hypothetical protein